MNNAVKTEIAQAANRYITEKDLTNAKFSTICGVSASYLSNILNGIFTYSSGNGDVEIADKYFTMIAQSVGYAIKKNYWPHIDTREFKETMGVLVAAKKDQSVRTLIMPTGHGKTYAIQQFGRVNPLHTYVIVMHSLVKITDVFNELTAQLNIPRVGSAGYKRAMVLVKLREIKKNGGQPLIILDEGENMNEVMMRMLKGLYDGLNGYCGIVLIGTEQLFELMEKAKIKDKQSGPQFYRRFKPGLRHIKIVQRKDQLFLPFFEHIKLELRLRKLLVSIADNYGELHDYLEPVLKAADEHGAQVTEDFFRAYHNMAE